MWKLDGTTLRAVGCAKVRAWVAKSGKTGMGITMRLEPVADARCTARVTDAHVEVGGVRVPAARLPAAAVVEPGNVTLLYVPFAWDNEAGWNDGVRKGVVSFRIDLDGHVATWSVPMTHRYTGPHYTVDHRGPRKQGQW